jgi:hypothetical protein
LNDQPEGLFALLSRFENGEAIYWFVREHLRCARGPFLRACPLSGGRHGALEKVAADT